MLPTSMNLTKLYVSYNRSVHVFIMCFVALLGPLFINSGIQPEFRDNLIFGVPPMGYFLYHVIKIMRLRSIVNTSDYVAFFWVPVGCLILGIIFVIVSYGI